LAHLFQLRPEPLSLAHLGTLPLLRPRLQHLHLLARFPCLLLTALDLRAHLADRGVLPLRWRRLLPLRLSFRLLDFRFGHVYRSSAFRGRPAPYVERAHPPGQARSVESVLRVYSVRPNVW
jgi:hypothetical protein